MKLLVTSKTKMCIILIMMMVFPYAYSDEYTNEENSVYISSENPMLDIQHALDKAKDNNKLLLVVMGANWCHDSRGLAENFEDADLASLLADKYELVFIDVAYFKDLRSISQRFGQAHYYATPTVMIIDAKTERLINANDMHIWGSASKIPLSKYVDYFTTYANSPVPVFTPLPEDQKSLIIAFEQRSSQRLADAYKVLVPHMKLTEKTAEEQDLYIKYWVEVKKYRTSLQKDIQDIREQATESPYTPIVFPTYEPFSWETDV